MSVHLGHSVGHSVYIKVSMSLIT